jgi:hypothetical protein
MSDLRARYRANRGPIGASRRFRSITLARTSTISPNTFEQRDLSTVRERGRQGHRGRAPLTGASLVSLLCHRTSPRDIQFRLARSADVWPHPSAPTRPISSRPRRGRARSAESGALARAGSSTSMAPFARHQPGVPGRGRPRYSVSFADTSDSCPLFTGPSDDCLPDGRVAVSIGRGFAEPMCLPSGRGISRLADSDRPCSCAPVMCDGPAPLRRKCSAWIRLDRRRHRAAPGRDRAGVIRVIAVRSMLGLGVYPAGPRSSSRVVWES